MESTEERCAPQRFEGPFGDEEGKGIAFTHLHGGEGLYGCRVDVGVGGTVIFERETQAVPHMVDVPLDRFAGYIQFGREPRAVQRSPVAKTFMYAHHALDGEAGTEAGLGS